jgi:CheY-like chemotaxis protein/anti-sigma regulatory factor (Ser/Thr protein kinase)
VLAIPSPTGRIVSANESTVKQQLKILVVDDLAANRMLVREQLRHMGFRHVVEADNGAAAVAAFQAEPSDLVLMDVIMPVMDGHEAAAQIKEMSSARWVPIVFLTGAESEAQHLRCLEVGDDFLSRPIHFVILKAKIEAILRTLKLQEQIRQKNNELQQYYHNAEEEKRVTAHLMQNMVAGPGLRDPVLKTTIVPAEYHSGDVIMAARAPNQALFLMLADGTGHGLAAAINVMPLPQIFYAMVSKGFTLPSLLQELNGKACGWLPRDRFVAATLVEINEREQTIRVWNGGNPDVLLIGPDGTVRHSWRSRHLPLGILPESEFDAQFDSYFIDAPGQLVLYSDGLLEAADPAYDRFGQDRLVATLAQPAPADRFDAVLAALTAHLRGRPAHDDVSLMFAEIGTEGATPQLNAPEEKTAPPPDSTDNWRLRMELTASEIRYYDLAPHLLSLLEKIEDVKPHKTSLFLVLSELLVNAVDHGLLKLESDVKHTEGFERYLNLREQRLAALQHGAICVTVEKSSEQGRRTMVIAVRDSGGGFDYHNLERHLENHDLPYGRGLGLVRSLASRIEFRDDGSEVVVYYPY